MSTQPEHSPRPLPEQLRSLAEIALDLRWSWNHGSDALWERIDPDLWRAAGNPWLILQTVSHRRLRGLAEDTEFQRLLEDHLAQRRSWEETPSWFARHRGKEALNGVAYFSMEYGISEALPLYSGGLGILAGDTLKTASDLGVPLVALGLLYQRGYFRQAISADGEQLEYYPYNAPAMLPISPLRDDDGEWLRVRLPLPGRTLLLRCWQARIGRIRLYLLDSNDPQNIPRDRGITGELYGGDLENRLTQELILGVGGWELLEALGMSDAVEVCHLNEGHAAFVGIARAAAWAKKHRLSFEAALTVTRASNLFTTHTPVDAAFDRFPHTLMKEYLAPYLSEWGLSMSRLLQFGEEPNPQWAGQFNMAWLAVRTSGAVNGVSHLHARVSRHLFEPLFPRWARAEIPVNHVTNGVHTPTWDSEAADKLWTDVCGPERWREELSGVGESMEQLPAAALWKLRSENRHMLIQALSRIVTDSRRRRGEPEAEVSELAKRLDPDALTIGFARRFTAYKRPDLLLHDPERLLKILSDRQRPLQIVVAGKAHPRDEAGKLMIRKWLDFLRQNETWGRVVFVEDYDMAIAAKLVQGVDVWLNMPRRPWEASGTSGMKVLVNGGLNLSILDGWWNEAYSPNVGWALGDGHEHPDFEAIDREESEALYHLLEEQIIPSFYERDAEGVPRTWVEQVRASMAQLTPDYSSNRMLREYAENFYLPLAMRFKQRSENDGATGKKIEQWLAFMNQHWPKLRIDQPRFVHEDEEILVEAHAYLDSVDPKDVSVELYADAERHGERPEKIALTLTEPLIGTVSGFRYSTKLKTSRPLEDYTLRIVPVNPDISVPLECGLIIWQR